MPPKMAEGDGRPPIDWVRAYASFAALTTGSLVLPFVPSYSLRVLWLPMLAGGLGLGIGALIREILGRTRRRQRLTVGMTLVPVVAALGGGTLATLGIGLMALPDGPGPDGLTWFVLTTWGSATAWFQTAWFVPVTLHVGRYGRSLSTAVLLGPTLAWISASVGLVVSFVAAVVVTIVTGIGP